MHSLPPTVTPTTTSLYEKTLQMLATDVNYQKEVALGKRIGFYRLGKELGCGNFSKVKLGVHVLTKGTLCRACPLDPQNTPADPTRRP